MPMSWGWGQGLGYNSKRPTTKCPDALALELYDHMGHTLYIYIYTYIHIYLYSNYVR